MSLKPTCLTPGRMRITEVNPHLICALCGGYLIDATTIVECLHSFCKTCIMRYLETSKYCPICEVLIHKTRPWQNIRLDDTLQTIVYKVVPGLFQREMKRRREYYDNQPVPSKSSGRARTTNRIIFSQDEEFSISLEFWPEGPNSTETNCKSKACDKLHDRRYLLCPAALNMSHLKRFIRNKYSLSDRYQIDIYHTNQPLSDHFTLIDVAYIYSWRREGILRLFYAFYLNEAKKMKVDIDMELKPEIDEIKQEVEPLNQCKEPIFGSNISIIETEKKPTELPKPPLPNGESSPQDPKPISSTMTQLVHVVQDNIPQQSPVKTNINNNHDDKHNTDVVIFDDDEEDEREMQIVVEEIEIDDSESNLEIVIDDNESEKRPQESPVRQPEILAQSKPKPDTKSDVLNVPSFRPPLPKSISETSNSNEAKQSTMPPLTTEKQPMVESTPKPKPNHFEEVRNYVKSQLPQSPSKDAQSQTVNVSKSSSVKDHSHPSIPKATVKDTALQVVTSRPAPSPVKDLAFRYPATKSDKREAPIKHVISSPKSPTRLLITSKDIFPKHKTTSPKGPSSNHHSSSKKDGVRRLSNDNISLVATNSAKKDSPHRLILSIHKDTSSKPGSTNNKDTQKANNTQTYVSSTKETFSRPLPSPKKETASQPPPSPNRVSSSPNRSQPSSPNRVPASSTKILSCPNRMPPSSPNKVSTSTNRIPTSPTRMSPSPNNRISPSPNKITASQSTMTTTANKMSTPHSMASNSGKDATSKISNNTIKETAAQIGKPKPVPKDSNSHSHTVKSMIKESNSSGGTPHIKHVPQVPKLVKAPITQLKPPSSEAYRHNPHLIPKWQPHLNNGYYKPPQEKPLELKREAVPIDYSKPS